MPSKEAASTDLDQIQLTQFLSHQHLCDSLTIGEIHILLGYLTLMDLKKGEILSDIGDVGDSLYLVVKGEIAVTFDERGEEGEVVRAASGGLVGVMSFFDKQPRSVRLVAKAPKTQVLKLSRAMYKRMKVEQPYIAINIVEQAIISLDNLFRRVSSDFAQFSHYLYGAGYK
ncbi:Crp/Fnr family transcriptional regulator [Sulfurirhabdus autotrophica]|uniref:Cyclic nucleotide-binding protein n=1 Tax=Sulfurirhabdus autotrophica TaxID=1706046 RepID=A0A4R3Y1I4_9PROT|nr:cyclic nucleotide-binding domain-containing protein [Sulfurirhabdus autotrophica]TCV84074.1 cyclic nucleotide-binding protein [Sulfurirhabdus autotrophica]